MPTWTKIDKVEIGDKGWGSGYWGTTPWGSEEGYADWKKIVKEEEE